MASNNPQDRVALLDEHNNMHFENDNNEFVGGQPQFQEEGETATGQGVESKAKNSQVDLQQSDHTNVNGNGDSKKPKKKLMKETALRWVMLMLSCFFLMGNYFCSDNPATLQSTLEKTLDINTSQYGLFVTLYSAPNFVLPLIGGILLDKIGVRAGLIAFTILVTLGQGVFMLGGYYKSFAIMLAGRFIFGLGGECMCVAQSTITSNWFKGKEMNFALGANLALARIGSVIAGYVVPRVNDAHGLGFAFAVGFGVCIFSTLCAIGIVLMDISAEKEEKEVNNGVEAVGISDEDKFQWSDIMKLSVPFWMLATSCCLTYMSVFPYNQISSKLMQDRYGFDEITASTLYIIPYLMSAFLTPILGIVVDKVGHRVIFMLMSSIILVAAYSISMFLPECDKCYYEMVPLALSGVGYSIYATTIWGSIPYTVPPSAVGTAFGMCTAIQNIGQGIAPQIIGPIQEHTEKNHGWFWVVFFFVAINVFGIIWHITLYIIDIRRHDGVLDQVDSDDRLTLLIASPEPGKRTGDIIRASMGKTRASQALVEYKVDPNVRASLRRSLARRTPMQ